MKVLGKLFDERFLEHRKRSTSTAGVISGQVAAVLFAYRLYIQHRFSWDLAAVLLAFVVIKLGLMTWYYLTD
jgi:hypothetical protein